MDAPSAEDMLPGGTERLVRLVLGDEMADHLNRKHPGRINVYADAVRFMIQTLHAMGAVDGKHGLPVEFPADLMGLKPVENRLLLEGLVASGRFVRVGAAAGAEPAGRVEPGVGAALGVRSQPEGYRLTKAMFLAIVPGSGQTQ
ncbi:MAG TPA: hypothetical protein VFC25_12115 [Verrucomicrobiae bacterium]|jgi:hypothetical protein|nr:hypothetical protein [Verrucomicrobiae bacterium]